MGLATAVDIKRHTMARFNVIEPCARQGFALLAADVEADVLVGNLENPAVIVGLGLHQLDGVDGEAVLVLVFCRMINVPHVICGLSVARNIDRPEADRLMPVIPLAPQGIDLLAADVAEHLCLVVLRQLQKIAACGLRRHRQRDRQKARKREKTRTVKTHETTPL